MNPSDRFHFDDTWSLNCYRSLNAWCADFLPRYQQMGTDSYQCLITLDPAHRFQVALPQRQIIPPLLL